MARRRRIWRRLAAVHRRASIQRNASSTRKKDHLADYSRPSHICQPSAYFAVSLEARVVHVWCKSTGRENTSHSTPFGLGNRSIVPRRFFPITWRMLQLPISPAEDLWHGRKDLLDRKTHRGSETQAYEELSGFRAQQVLGGTSSVGCFSDYQGLQQIRLVRIRHFSRNICPLRSRLKL